MIVCRRGSGRVTNEAFAGSTGSYARIIARLQLTSDWSVAEVSTTVPRRLAHRNAGAGRRLALKPWLLGIGDEQTRNTRQASATPPGSWPPPLPPDVDFQRDWGGGTDRNRRPVETTPRHSATAAPGAGRSSALVILVHFRTRFPQDGRIADVWWGWGRFATSGQNDCLRR